MMLKLWSCIALHRGLALEVECAAAARRHSAVACYLLEDL